jgi:formate hydrogenlyase subunit 3/multisubunit Na+/H+ antiporter MnhD subunit
MSPVTALLSGLMVLIGLAMIVRTVASGGGPLAVGLLMGLLFVAAGAGRLWAERRR